MSATVRELQNVRPRSESDEWWSPRPLVAAAAEWCGVKRFAVDLAATRENTVGEGFLTAADGPPAAARWAKVLELGAGWCNPPFSKPNLPQFSAAAVAVAPVLVAPLCLLVPCSPSSAWFRRLWDGRIVGSGWREQMPLRGRTLLLEAAAHRAELLFFDYRLSFLIDGERADSARGAHVLVKLEAKR